MNISKLSWKNIWRNKVRSGVILGAIAIGLFAGTYLSAFMTGWVLGTVRDDIASNLSHIQIHDSTFLINNDIGAYFPKDDIEKTVRSSGIEAKVSCRLRLVGMLASANNAVGVVAKGVFTDEEKEVSNIFTLIPDTLGSYLPDDVRMPIVISRKTADKLKARLRTKLVFTFQDANGDMQSLAFRVAGIFRTNNGMFDESAVFVRYNDIFAATKLPDDAVHEAGITVADLDACKTAAPRIKALFPRLKTETWDELNPMLAISMEWTDIMSFIIVGIFLLSLSFGIINTMLMAVLERTREIGMLRAIGMSRWRIFNMLILETVFLTLLGSVAGILFALAVVLPSLHSGLDLTPLMGDDFVDWGFGSVIYPVLNVRMFAGIIFLVILTGILSAIYPALKVLNINVLEAIRR
jgi:ABC-type lipoprotein release transport system permease subunit